MAAIAYYFLQKCIIATQGPESELKRAVGTDWKGKLSPVLYGAAIGASFWMPLLAQAIYIFVALMWLVPDKRIERVVNGTET